MRTVKIYFKPIFFAFGFGLSLVWFVQSCSSTHAVAQKEPVYQAPDIHQIIRPDTSKGKKGMTPEQLQSLMDKAYQYNYNRFFLPDFRRITAENEMLKNDLHTLTDRYGVIVDLMKLSKHQKDSVIRSNDQLQDMLYKADLRAVQAEKDRLLAIQQNTAQFAKNMESTDKVLKSSNFVSKILLCIGLVIVVAFFGLLLFNILMFRRLKKAEITLAELKERID